MLLDRTEASEAVIRFCREFIRGLYVSCRQRSSDLLCANELPNALIRVRRRGERSIRERDPGGAPENIVLECRLKRSIDCGVITGGLEQGRRNRQLPSE